MANGRPENRIARFLDTVGDGSGSKESNVNGSVTPVPFMYRPAAGQVVDVHRMFVHIEGSAAAFDAGNYGSLAAALPNGIQVDVRNTSDNSVVVDLVDGIPVVSNHDWTIHCYDITYHDFGVGNGVKSLAVRWSFDRGGAPLRLRETEYLCVLIQDDLSGLAMHYVKIEGQKVGG